MALTKLINRGVNKSKKYILSVSQAKRTSIVLTTSLTSTEVIIGREAILPIELEHTTYST